MGILEGLAAWVQTAKPRDPPEIHLRDIRIRHRGFPDTQPSNPESKFSLITKKFSFEDIRSTRHLVLGGCSWCPRCEAVHFKLPIHLRRGHPGSILGPSGGNAAPYQILVRSVAETLSSPKWILTILNCSQCLFNGLHQFQTIINSLQRSSTRPIQADPL